MSIRWATTAPNHIAKSASQAVSAKIAPPVTPAPTAQPARKHRAEPHQHGAGEVAQHRRTASNP
jgi:hypothetical protein